MTIPKLKYNLILLTEEEVMKNRSNAYEFLDFDKEEETKTNKDA